MVTFSTLKKHSKALEVVPWRSTFLVDKRPWVYPQHNQKVKCLHAIVTVNFNSVIGKSLSGTKSPKSIYVASWMPNSPTNETDVTREVIWTLSLVMFLWRWHLCPGVLHCTGRLLQSMWCTSALTLLTHTRAHAHAHMRAQGLDSFQVSNPNCRTSQI